ncbi:MAG: NAD-dependent epimerase/dehydratase family protein [Salana multivorans]|uniref:NAD-dependent epimerase/dehydratase family protein n=1 Tax=Salana multivorans TaxID=120377 RepID=UPI000962B966|nr:NAD-dependent epimerase/dehydratase family protein [Salana multivorans]MBN8883506.1 NAD-dependent epimerase/dehydratase family protein [Salana multivorans]OJX93959.1 MAG: hypothetical protein BGO96_00410 [Micrococcales bacterium 73-15]
MSATLVVGGTGLLGFHTVTELLERGHDVTSLALPGAPDGLLPERVEAVWGNLEEMPDEDVLALLDGKHAVFYAIGADERTTPPAPAAHFFYEANVRSTQRLARLARRAGVRKLVVFGSYTAQFAQEYTDIPYAANGYPRTRLAQEEIAELEGIGAMDVMTLRLPYIFGLVAGQRPLWQFVLDVVASQQPVVAVPAGSTSSVTARQVGRAAVGAMEHGTHGGRYPINAYDLGYAELHRLACEAIGRDPRDVVVAPKEAFLPAFAQIDAQTAAAGLEHGIHMVDTAEFQARDAVSDPGLSSVLGMGDDDVPAAIRETFAWCVAHPATA